MILKRISVEEAHELTDSILVSVGAEDADSITASVVWMVEGDILSDQGPLTVPEALARAQIIADEQGKDTVYVDCHPDTFEWDDAWGTLS